MNFLKQKKGFTLIEILAALAVFSSTALILSRVWSGNTKRMHKIQQYKTATSLLRTKMTELELDWRRKTFNSIPSFEEGDFKEEEHFSWSVRTQKLPLPGAEEFMKQAGAESEAGRQIGTAVHNVLTQSVLEVKLTLHFKQGERKSDYSITSYIVDYSQKALPGVF